MRTKEEVRLDLVTAVDAYVYRCKDARAQARFRDRIEYLLCECDAIRAVEKFEPMEAQYIRESEDDRSRMGALLQDMSAQFRDVVDRFEASPEAQRRAQEFGEYVNKIRERQADVSDDQNPGANL